MKLARLGTALLLLSLYAGCAPYGPAGEIRDGGADVDVGPMGPPDAGFTPGPERSGEIGTCYDGIDNDLAFGLDCADSECADDPVCCVGSADCCAMGETITLAVPTTCVDGPLSDCADLASGLAPFGDDGMPTLEAGALVPQGGRGHGGVTLGGARDPRAENLTVTATLRVPATRCADCIDGVGIGFLDGVPGSGELASVRLGVLASGSRNEVQIVVADEIVERLELPVGMLELSLSLRTDGTATIGAGAESRDLDGVFIEDAVLPVAYGRTSNRASGEPAIALVTAQLLTEDCDTPAALDRRSVPVMPGATSTWVPGALGRPSAVVLPTSMMGRASVAFEHDGEILFGRETGNAEITSQAGDPAPQALSVPTIAVRAGDPWLVGRGSAYSLFFTGETSAGVRMIFRSDATEASPTPAFPTPSEPVLSPALIDGARSIEAPTVWVETPDGEPARWHMIARVETDLGERVFVAFEGGALGDAWVLRGGDLAGSIVRVPQTDDLFAMDRDEIADPALVRATDSDGVTTLRLYYAGRRGTRWAIGLLVSQDGLTWRAMGEVLSPRGSGFDALGVRGPAPVVRADGSTQLFYLGSNGARSAFGLAGPAGTVGE